jgi:hypothetical protein
LGGHSPIAQAVPRLLSFGHGDAEGLRYHGS